MLTAARHLTDNRAPISLCQCFSFASVWALSALTARCELAVYQLSALQLDNVANVLWLTRSKCGCSYRETQLSMYIASKSQQLIRSSVLSKALLRRPAISHTTQHPLPAQPLRHRSATTKRPHKHAVIPPPPVNVPSPTHPYLPDINPNTTNTALVTEPIGIREYLLYVTVALGSMFFGAQIVHWIFKPDLHIPSEQELKERELKVQQQAEQKRRAAATPQPVAVNQPAATAAAPPQQAAPNQ